VRVDGGVAVRAVADRPAELGPRHAMSGQPLPARFPQVAAAVAEGAISARHGALICRTIAELLEAAMEQAGAVETMLVEHARMVNPDQLAELTRTVRACLDPDGVLASERDHERGVGSFRGGRILTGAPDHGGGACRGGVAIHSPAHAIFRAIG
jgi:hypothetical protein